MGCQVNNGTDRIPITLCPHEFDADPMSRGFQLVEIDSRCFVMVIDGQVELSISIEISDGDSAAVLNGICARRPGDINELPIPRVGKQAVVFVSIP